MNSKSLLIQWNNRRPLDYLYRRKYNIGFNSPEHRQLSQINIYYNWLEEKLYNEYEESRKDELEREKELQKGIWLREAQFSEVSDEWFDKIDVEDIDSQIQVND